MIVNSFEKFYGSVNAVLFICHRMLVRLVLSYIRGFFSSNMILIIMYDYNKCISVCGHRIVIMVSPRLTLYVKLIHCLFNPIFMRTLDPKETACIDLMPRRVEEIQLNIHFHKNSLTSIPYFPQELNSE